ncbi:putative gamma-glutamylcyclotransferase CG2811 isoform X2 [Drosophila erecta]|uniref:putative gamma-glutamylcyclotransferase CG2811 isoform X2 n=1 Tax=Drosophila erecta TaxID=7220 RepID=UPI000F04FE4F|nr:putative gamma-glutamylcyclotransferase CG2811 isoform X2 [Drosophila erecta]
MGEKLRMAARVFVYGTLKRGEPNHHWLTKKENGQARFLGRGKTDTKFPLVVGTRYNIPFLLARPGEGNHIEGEVYEVDQTMLSKLDILEDYPDYYDREQQTILMEQNEEDAGQGAADLLPQHSGKAVQRKLLGELPGRPGHG